MGHSVQDFANYIIIKETERGSEVNSMRLQLLLFYVQGRHLLEKGTLLFEDPIMKGKNGPLIPAVSERFAHYGAFPIAQVPVEFDFMTLLDEKPTMPVDKDPEIPGPDSETAELIEDSLLNLSGYCVLSLIEETKRHPAWLAAMEQVFAGKRDIAYTEMELLMTFCMHPQFRIWNSLYQDKKRRFL